MPPENETVIRTHNLRRLYHSAGDDVIAVNDVSLEIFPAQMTAIVGRSGAGKTTLLNLLSGLDMPTSGDVWIQGQQLNQLSEGERLTLRRERIGFVFQTFGLLPLLSAAENVGVPLRMRRFGRQERDERVALALKRVGLANRASHRPYELSGGEQQRVAIARVIAAQPDIILADEPTGQLDSQTGERVLTLLREIVVEQRITLVVVTHDPQVMQEADVVHELQDGKLVDSRHQQQVVI